ncbi:MAG: GAF domain-containing protein [Deltaproteobacteria bacterium]|nr:MAG: GAF domain-containing protein [Deltaproteobacteria bacterium]
MESPMGVASREEIDSLHDKLRGDLPASERAATELALGRLCARSGLHDEALHHFSAARRLFDSLGDRAGVGAADAAIGASCGAKGEPDRARIHLDRALAVADDLGDADLKARALNALAHIALRAGEYERAQELFTRARSHFEQHFDGAELATIHCGLARLAAARDQLEDARALARRAEEDARASGDSLAIGRALMCQAVVAWRTGDVKHAKRYFRRAMTAFQTDGYRRELAEAYLQFGLFMGDAGHQLGDGFNDPPAYWLAKAQELFRELGGLYDLERVREAFRQHGRRATDRVAEVEVLQLLQELKQHRMAVHRESQRLADLVGAAVETIAKRTGAPVSAVDETQTRIAAVEQTLSRSLDAMAMAEERFLGAVNAVVVERENIRTLLELTQSLARVDDYGRLPSEIAHMAAQLSNADRAFVALADPDTGDLAVHGVHNVADDEAATRLLDLSETARGGGAATLLFRADAAPGAPSGDAGRAGDGRSSDPPPTADAERQRRLRLGYAMVVPLRRGRDVYGIIYADKELSGGVFTERDLDLLSVFAGQAATALENGRIQEELRVQIRATATTLEAIRDGVVTFNAGGIVIAMNEEASRILGVRYDPKRPPRLTRMPELDFLRPSIVGGEEYDGRNVNLPTGDYLCSTRVIRDDRGDIAGVVATFTELKRATSVAQRIVGSTARYSFADIIGVSAALKRRLALAEAAARSDSSVLITGESGTGKELFAQAIHNAGPRAGGPFVGINCAAIPRDLLESELFGYETGAFTGARRGGRPGKFELAEGGTILLDEIGDMPLEMQAKLLRVLQEKVTQRLGGTREIPLNCRVIGTTNRDLSAEVARGLFRQDLYFRLRVIHIDLPPLRERPEDVEVLARHFLQIYAARLGKPVRDIAPHVMDALRSYPWPGNIRELEHVLEGEVNLAGDDQIALTEVPLVIEQARRDLQRLFPPAFAGAPPGNPPTGPAAFAPVPPALGGYPGPPLGGAEQPPRLKSMVESERELLIAALAQHRGNIPSVARTLGVSRGTVYNKMKKFNIDPSEFRS